MSAAADTGLYKPGQSVLYRIDPRLKVVSCLVVVALAFAATNWGALAFLSVLAGLALWLISPQGGGVWRIVWLLRWILLFTFLMHVLFTPGRTLLGMGWVSYDGLLTGAFVCLQVVLAIIFAAVMMITTSMEQLFGVFSWLVQPLRRLGCRTEDWLKVLCLAVSFLPMIRQEAHLVASQAEDFSGWSGWVHKQQSVLQRVVTRADGFAHEIAQGRDVCLVEEPLSPLLPMIGADRVFFVTMVLCVLCYWVTG